ncbi:unnamed protein product [Linum trigynum]|uniref:Reverse transcriptase domain-containing protein n=1 Tax=Linum trigynum TaxID=586398 RepID=A0AAV2FYF9_9ROSI
MVVRVANGAPMQCKTVYRELSFDIQGLPVTTDMFVLPIRGFDMILGVPWLQGLGPVTTDWRSLTMRFKWRDKEWCLQGLTTALGPVSLHECITGVEAELAVMCWPVASTENQELALDLQRVLAVFSELFQTPTTLSPHRQVDHRIQLKDGVEAVNARPYRYGHSQKEEIEQQVEEMLSTGLIRPSTSPFSSPVLLVKKKDGTWCFYTDYRALNVATVKDRFPIPTVDDMLGELHGSAYFTKLDLRAGYHQIRITEEDAHKTVFRMHNGHYEYLVMPFGL